MTIQQVHKQGINLLSQYTHYSRKGKSYTEFITDNYWYCEFRYSWFFAYRVVASTKDEAIQKSFERAKRAFERRGIEQARVLCWCEQIMIVAVEGYYNGLSKKSTDN